MGLMVVDADKWFLQRIGSSLRGLETDQQCRGQTRSLRGGDGVYLRANDTGLGQSGTRHGQEVLQMFARGEFGHHAAVFGMNLDLRGNGVGQNGAITHDGSAGFVTGCFDREDGHIGSQCIP